MITDLIDTLLRTVLLLVALLLGAAHVLPASSRVRCPAGWYVDGVRPSGEFACRPVLGRPEDDLRDAVRRLVIDDDRVVRGQLWCWPGAHPRQDGAGVWCQREP